MSVVTQLEVSQAAMARVQASLTSFPIVYPNQDDNTVANGTASWLKVKINHQRANQLSLGDQDSTRNYGALVFIIFVRKGNGVADRDIILRDVVDLFRGKFVGGATFQNCEPLLEGNNENWAMSGYQIPFYFDSN